MSKNIVIIISTAEKEKALTGVLYATNAIKKNWFNDVKVFFFGPVEKLVAEDKDFQAKVEPLLQYQKPVACKFLSDQDNISNTLEDLGYQVDYVGSAISAFIEDGYTPLVF